MKVLYKSLISVFAFLLLSGCSDKPNYVHVEPDAHPIPANTNIVMPEIIEEDRSRGNLVIEDEDSASVDIGTFINKYHEKNKPKFIIYMNKVLGEEVSVVGSEIRIAFNSPDKQENWVLQAIKTTSQPVQSSRYYELFIDKMEKGFISSFLDSKVKVLDRSYLLRSQELKYDKQDKRKTFSVLEMDALKEQASVFISVVPVFSNVKVEFNIKAINLSDGQILADYSSDLTSGNTKQIVLTEKGYEVIRGGNLDKRMQKIAKECMVKIGLSW